MAALRLVTIPISHYGERARWALDHAALDYDEEHHLQMFSWVAALRRSGRKTLPVLVTPDGVLGDSADIVRYASARAASPLYPDDPVARDAVERFERDVAEGYGVEGRRLAYGWFFRVMERCLPYNAGRAPPWEVRAVELARGLARRFLTRYLDLSPAAMRRAKDVVRRTLDDVARRLADGRPYLFGDRFTAADLTFASLSAPVVAPPQYPVPLPDLALLPEEARAAVFGDRAHPAGAFALRLYTERPATRGRYERPMWRS